MSVLAADTWGINGSSFLLLYGVLGIGWFCLVWQARARLLGGGAPGPMPPLSQCELAMMNGGEGLAITAAATHLQSAGMLEAGERRRTVRATGRRSPDVSGVELAILELLGREPEIPIAALRRRLVTGEAVRQLRARLEHDGCFGPEVEITAELATIEAAARRGGDRRRSTDGARVPAR